MFVRQASAGSKVGSIFGVPRYRMGYYCIIARMLNAAPSASTSETRCLGSRYCSGVIREPRRAVALAATTWPPNLLKWRLARPTIPFHSIYLLYRMQLSITTKSSLHTDNLSALPCVTALHMNTDPRLPRLCPGHGWKLRTTKTTFRVPSVS